MNCNTISHKLKVFISSRCDSPGMIKYAPVRKALKHLLEETGMIETYCFEAEPASSVSLPNDYISELRDSKLIILLVDNKDGYSDAVLMEYQYAKANKIRIIALFCDEEEKKKTPIELEIISLRSAHYEPVHEFADIAYSAYKAVMQDLLKVYKIESYEDHEKSNDETSTTQIDNAMMFGDVMSSDLILDKKFLKDFEVTKNAMVYYLFKEKDLKHSSNDLDNDFASFLATVLCEGPFNAESFDVMKGHILSKHNEKVRGIIEKRLECLKLYYTGDIELLEQKLEGLLTEVKEKKGLAEWLKNDIAIDMRNIHLKTKRFDIFNVGQKVLDESKQFVCYPPIDRLSSDIKSKVIDFYQNYFQDSPYTTRTLPIEFVLSDITTYYCAALYYGSITHLTMTRNLLIELLCALRTINNSPKIFTQLVKFTILQRDGKLLESIMRSSIGLMMNFLDTENLISSINNLPIEKDQNIAKLILIKNLGYYLTDNQFEELSNWLFNFTEKYFLSKRNYIEYRDILLTTYKSCYKRLSNSKLFVLINKLFNINQVDSIDLACNLISCLDIKRLTSKEQIEISLQLEKIIKEKQRRENIQDFQIALLSFCKYATINLEQLKKAISEYMPDFYKNEFILEIYEGDRESNLRYINSYVGQIEMMVKSQTEHQYTKFAGNPCETIVNIIRYRNLVLNEDEITHIVNAVKNMILSSTQMSDDKMHAFLLLIYLANKFPKEYLWGNLSEELYEKTGSVLSVSNFDFWDTSTVATIKFYLNIFRLITNKLTNEDEITLWSNIFLMEDSEKINCLRLLSQVLEETEQDILKKNLNSIVQLCIAMIGNKERDICYFATKCIVALCDSVYKDIILQQFSKIIDYGDVNSKVIVVRYLMKMSEKSDIVNFMLKKAKTDKNYFVRNELKEHS